MKYLLILLFLFPGHKHKSTKQGQYDPLMYKDSTTIKANVITYVLRSDSCGVCHNWFKVRQNIDTFSTKKKGIRSNLKYKKH